MSSFHIPARKLIDKTNMTKAFEMGHSFVKTSKHKNMITEREKLFHFLKYDVVRREVIPVKPKPRSSVPRSRIRIPLLTVMEKCIEPKEDYDKSF